jgi:hypothetical protein
MCNVIGYFVLVAWTGKQVVCLLENYTSSLWALRILGFYVGIFVHGSSVIVDSCYIIFIAGFRGYIPDIVL